MAAIEAGVMTMALPQPSREPPPGPKARRRYTNWPPAFGIAAPSSAMQSAPQSETTAPTTQTRRVGKDAVNAAAIVLGTMKMDDAMIVPTLIIASSIFI